MVDQFLAENDRIQVIRDSEIAFDTDRISVERFPDADHIVLTNYDISFPSFVQFAAYYRNQTGGGLTTCERWSTLIWQEWGPDESTHDEVYYPANPGASIPGPTTRPLTRTLLGSVPAESNYLDIRVNLNRIVTPPAFHGLEVPTVLFKQNQWITLPGGSCPCEVLLTSASRLFNIVRIGNDIYLDRYQSVFNTNSPLAPGGYAQANISVNQSGWNSFNQRGSPSDGSSVAPYANNILYHLMDQKPYSLDGNKRPGGTNPCGGSHPDLTSTYRGSIVIAPCRHRT